MSHETSISHYFLFTELFRHFNIKILKTQIQFTQINNRVDKFCKGQNLKKLSTVKNYEFLNGIADRLVKEYTLMTSKFRLNQFTTNRQGTTIITSLPLALGPYNGKTNLTKISRQNFHLR